jgi:iron complex outermembrane receptor protein
MNTGIDYASSTGHNNYSNNAAWTYPGLGQKLDYTGVTKSRLLDLYANYSKVIDNHKIDATVGYSYQAFDRDGSNFQRNGAETIFTNSALTSDGKHVPQPLVSNPNVLLSFFGRLNYSFKDKYMLTASFRDDASSRFAKQNRWVVFPAIGGAWRINKESFMEGAKFFSDLKVRASYGITGQQDVANNAYPYLSTYQVSNSTAQYQFGNTFYNTYRPQAYDANLKWETTAQTDIGIDFGIFNNRITGTVDYYQKETSNLIVTVPTAAGSNFSNFVTTNVGNLENKGYEITLRGVAIKKQDLEWDIGFNFTHNENKITKLIASNDPTFTIPYGGIGLSKYIQTIQVGSPIYSYLVNQQVYDTKGKPVEGVYVGTNGTTPFNVFHKPQPDYLMGINSRVNYKKWDFYFQSRVSLGNYNYNAVAASAYYANLFYTTGYFNNLPSSVNDTKFSSIQSYSSHYVQNASFFKMDNISLGYNFQQLFTQKLRARLSFTVQNAFWISKYKGIDPEVDGGIDNNIYPRPRVFLLGFNVTY